jgi:hypothetical protein
MMCEFVHLVVQEWMGRHSEDEDAAGQERRPQEAQHAVVVVHMLEDIEHGQHLVSAAKGWQAAFVHANQGHIEPIPHKLEAFQVGVAGAGNRNSP